MTKKSAFKGLREGHNYYVLGVERALQPGDLECPQVPALSHPKFLVDSFAVTIKLSLLQTSLRALHTAYRLPSL